MAKISKIMFFTKALVTEGGAERLMLEVANYFQKSGIEVRIIATAAVDSGLLFSGKYSDLPITQFSDGYYPQTFIKKIFFSLVSTIKLKKSIKEFAPDMIVGQNPADAEILYLATFGGTYAYSTFIHGTLFCFPDDQLKYSGPFKKSFPRIRDSVPSYEQFIPPKKATQSFFFQLL